MKNIWIIVYFSLALFAIAGCVSEGRQYDQTLDRVDELMTDHPDSALAIISAVDTAGLSQEQIARYALLLTKALEKNSKESRNDTLIRKAVDYYCGHNNAEEIQALYLYASVLENKDSFKVALPYATMAFEKAEERKDWFYKGMSARLLSDLYKLLYIFPDEKKYAIISKEAFLKYEKEKGIDNRYSAWMDNMIASSMSNNGEYENSLSVCESIDSAALAANPTLRHSILYTKAKNHFKLGNPERSIQIYDTLISDGYKMEGWNWNRLSEYHFYAGNKDKARAALDSAKNNISYAQDTIFIAYLEYLLANPEDPKQTLKALNHYKNTAINVANDLIINSPLHNITESYQKQADEYKRHIRTQRIIFGSIICLFIIFLLFASVSIYRHLHRRKEENIYLQKEIEAADDKYNELRDKNVLLLKEYETITTEFNLLKESGKPGSKNQIEVIRAFLKQFDDYCSKLYLVQEKEKRSSIFIQQSISRLTSEKFLAELDGRIDIYSDGFINIIRKNFPRMRQSRLRLVRYLYANFSLETMILLCAVTSRNSIDRGKSDLKNRIITKENWVETDSGTALKITHCRSKYSSHYHSICFVVYWHTDNYNIWNLRA